MDLCSIRPVSAEYSIPEKVDHRKICFRMLVMNEVQCLFAPEPCKPLQSRPLDMIFPVEKYVGVERCRTRGDVNQEQINWQYEKQEYRRQKRRDKKKWCVVAFVVEIHF